ncbi:MAG: hypothetical protein ACLGH0_11585, partial [Thermoanaerobaculia bacterium]
VWSINIATTVLAILIWLVVHPVPQLTRRRTRTLLAAASIITILLPFASEGILGVHRWISVAGLRLHASAIAAPLIILCVATVATHRIGSALAIGATAAGILALQPDAAQTTSLAAACALVLVGARTEQMGKVGAGLALLFAISLGSFVRHDPLAPVAHVEGIFAVAASRGAVWAVMATISLLLLPVPFFAAWHHPRRPIALALGVYVSMTVLAPAWGTFPVPIMGYGASPILGYFLALAVAVGRPTRNAVVISRR